MKTNFTTKQAMAMLILAILTSVSLKSWGALATGDIAVIGYNSDGSTTTKDFAVVTLAKISSGETIYITDKGWTATAGGSFMADITTEGIFSWTTTADIAKGTVIRFAVAAGASPSVTASPSVGTLAVVNGWTSTSAASPFGTNGDQILIYQGSVAAPTFIFGFNAGIFSADIVNGWQTTATSGNAMSNIPTGLTNGTNAVSFTITATALDNYVYNGTLTGSKATILADICNTSKWLGDDANAYNLVPGDVSGRFPGANPIFGAAPVASAVASTGTLQVGQTLNGTYTYGDADGDPQSGSTFKWYRADDASGANKSAIGLATGQTYQLVAADENKYISFEVTPRDGAKAGTSVESALRGPILPVVLPVRLLGFSTKLISGSSILLSWHVAAQRDHWGFRIYRKGESGDFTRIADIPGQVDISRYEHMDRKPLKGGNYYRLMEVDINNSETELAVGSENLVVTKDEISVFPNPSNGPVTVSFPQGQYSRAELLDASGKLIEYRSIGAEDSSTAFDISSKQNTIFLVRLSGKGKTETRKVARK